MRSVILAVCLLLGTCVCAAADISVGIRLPGISIGINMPRYPDLAVIPGYPVYYAPDADSNFFFYDGLYWVYADDRWYASSWYNGPWDVVDQDSVPYFILRVPVRYYRRPPVYFRGWAAEAPPRWGEHWGRQWEQRRGGWDRWDRASAPAPAPLPTYQRAYAGSRYPSLDQQSSLHGQNYRYQPREPVVQREYQKMPGLRAPVQPPAQGRQDLQRPYDRNAAQPPREGRGAPPDRGPPSREAQPQRSREQNGERPGNAAPRDNRGNGDRGDRNDRGGDGGRPERDR